MIGLSLRKEKLITSVERRTGDLVDWIGFVTSKDRKFHVGGDGGQPGEILL